MEVGGLVEHTDYNSTAQYGIPRVANRFESMQRSSSMYILDLYVPKPGSNAPLRTEACTKDVPRD